MVEGGVQWLVTSQDVAGQIRSSDPDPSPGHRTGLISGSVDTKPGLDRHKTRIGSILLLLIFFKLNTFIFMIYLIASAVG